MGTRKPKTSRASAKQDVVQGLVPYQEGRGPVRPGDAIAQRILRLDRREVPLLSGPGALGSLPETLRRAGFSGQLWLVADRIALDLHGAAIERHLAGAPVLAISGSEGDKTLPAASAVWDWLVERGAQRRDALVAIGGGVVCDLVGFAAACYLRGIALVNVPTTLLAQVDASVGGKTGVNHTRGKNLIGAFHQPIAVVADTAFLPTLSAREFANGMAEVAKIAMTLDADLFARLERHDAGWDASTYGLNEVIARAIELKAEVVERDEREAGERLLLNYGHTIGHAVEAASGYGALLHGEAVAVGMHAAAEIAVAMALLDEASATRQAALLDRLGLPRRAEGLAARDVLPKLSLDKKRVGERQQWVLAETVGRATVRADVPPQLVQMAIERVTSGS